jgi:hypothetical protein
MKLVNILLFLIFIKSSFQDFEIAGCERKPSIRKLSLFAQRAAIDIFKDCQNQHCSNWTNNNFYSIGNSTTCIYDKWTKFCEESGVGKTEQLCQKLATAPRHFEPMSLYYASLLTDNINSTWPYRTWSWDGYLPCGVPEYKTVCDYVLDQIRTHLTRHPRGKVYKCNTFF